MRLIIDTDPGMGTVATDPEDGFAILYALASPEVTVEGICLTQGNVPISHSWPNAAHLLDLAGRHDIPLHVGARRPSRPECRTTQDAWLTHRAAMGRTVPEREPPDDTAVDFLVDTACGYPGEITVVAIGPLTNVAAAVEADSRFAGALAGLVVMGGTVAVGGNITPAAEFNIWMDPDAAAVVFESGAPITMVGLDVCHQTTFDRSRNEAMRDIGSPLATFVADASEGWIGIMEQTADSGDGLHLYDTLAMAAAIEPDLLGYRDAFVEVETGTGPAQGATVTHTNPILRQLLTGRDPNASVAVAVDVDRFEARFAERVVASLRSP